MKDGCGLCDLEHRTTWRYADDVLIICDCLTCGVPMVVFRRHGQLSLREDLHARQVVIGLYGKRLIKMRTKARLIKDHQHWHLYLEY